MRARSSRTSAPTVCRDLPERLARWDVGFMPFALNDATRHISPTKTRDFWPLGYRWFRRRFWTLSEPTGKLAWLELQPLLRTSFWKSKAHCANPASIGFGEWMPGLPCARGTKRGDPWSTIFAALASGSKTNVSTQTQPRRRRPVPSRPDC
jgi:hypothetical protein